MTLQPTAAEKLAAAIAGAIGDNDEEQGIRGYISTGFAPLDHAISGKYRNGGMPQGRIIEMFGPSSSGKTAVATRVMAGAQRLGGVAMFNDHERAFDIRQGKSLGLSETPGPWIYKRPRSYEESCDNAVKMMETIREKGLIDEAAPIVCCFDSLAAMIPRSKLDKEAAGYNMNDNTALARATSANMPALALFAEENNAMLIFLNQIRTKIGVMFGDPTTTPGGDSLPFYASVRIKLGKAMITKGDGEAKQTLGQRVGAQCIKNKISRPFLKASWDFMFREDGSGFFDTTVSTIDFLVARGLIEKSGNFLVWKGQKFYRGPLAAKIDAEGLQEELLDLLPADGPSAADDDTVEPVGSEGAEIAAA